jgi:hypothetical protein
MITFIKLYQYVMTDDGILIIEDIHKYEWIDILIQYVDESLKKKYMI